MRGRYFYAVKQLLPFTESYQPRFKAWRGPARRRVSSGASPAAELPLWSKLIPACPIPLERLQLIRLKDAFAFYGILPTSL